VPRVMKGAIGLTPLTVFLAVLAGAEFMGPIGALLAIPFAAALQVIVSDMLRTRRTRFTHDDPAGHPAGSGGSWRTVLTQFLGDTDSHPPNIPADPSEPTERSESAESVESGVAGGGS
jgi:hypothetical protein